MCNIKNQGHTFSYHTWNCLICGCGVHKRQWENYGDLLCIRY